MGCEMVARCSMPLGRQLQELFSKVGSFCPQREKFRLTAEVKEKSTEKLRFEPREFFGGKIGKVVRKDGPKLFSTTDSGYVAGFRERSR